MDDWMTVTDLREAIEAMRKRISFQYDTMHLRARKLDEAARCVVAFLAGNHNQGWKRSI